ncbi:hypothetical protein FCULG_00002804 [Fusarium culmorum]|uniref:DUF676 domain-containing protein n=1 Tax=Fusarium culmorum TaxID=5516 RepID=A0A2T4H6H2_FUSCU|nr:hypothetical protein FCULG_00002804 [Fusarium culmorum]
MQSPPGYFFDIVVVHGLNGHRDKTWTAANGVHWLRDPLRIDIPEARILSWGYDANTHAASETCCTFLYDHARTLVSDLNRRRELTNAGSTRNGRSYLLHIASAVAETSDM